MSILLGGAALFISLYGLAHWLERLPQAFGLLLFTSFAFGGAVAVLAGILSLKK